PARNSSRPRVMMIDKLMEDANSVSSQRYDLWSGGVRGLSIGVFYRSRLTPSKRARQNGVQNRLDQGDGWRWSLPDPPLNLIEDKMNARRLIASRTHDVRADRLDLVV